MLAAAVITLLAVECGLLQVSVASDASVVWDYAAHGPSTWPGLCQTGSAQSPINIDPTAVVVDANMPPITYHGYDKLWKWDIKASGLYVEPKAGEKLGISGGGLGGFYELIQFHFHWGAEQLKGSEHTVAGNHYATELHLVHSKEGYNLHEALSKPDGLAVIGVLFNVASVNGSESLLPLLTHMADRAVKGLKMDYAPMKLLPQNSNNFYRYQGSLTTPKCNETVTWTVMTDPIFMSQGQYNEWIRAITVDHGKRLHDTAFRPVQPLNGRTVTLRSDKIQIKKSDSTGADTEHYRNHKQKDEKSAAERKLAEWSVALTLFSAVYTLYCTY